MICLWFILDDVEFHVATKHGNMVGKGQQTLDNDQKGVLVNGKSYHS